MKTKSIAMVAMSGLLAASIAYVAPAMADELGSGMPMEQMLADNSSTNGMQPPADDTQSQSGTDATKNDSNNVGATSSDPSTPTGTDQGSSNDQGAAPSDQGAATPSDQGTPDTATGDDDY